MSRKTKSSWKDQPDEQQPMAEAATAASAGEQPGAQAAQLWASLIEVPLTCPSGAHVIATPPTLAIAVRAGRPPLAMANIIEKQKRGEDVSVLDMPPEEADKLRLYCQRLCEGILRAPRVVAPNVDGTIRQLREGESDARLIPDQDLYFLAKWADDYDLTLEAAKLRGTDGTEVTRSDALLFRDDAGVSTDGTNSEGIRTTHVEPARDQESTVGAGG